MNRMILALTMACMLGMTSAAHANVARYMYEGDDGYTEAKVSRIAKNVMMLTSVGLAGWCGYLTVRRRSLRAAGGVLLALFLFLASLSFSDLNHFMVGTPPPTRGFGKPAVSSPETQFLAESVAGTALSLALVIGGIKLARRNGNTTSPAVTASQADTAAPRPQTTPGSPG